MLEDNEGLRQTLATKALPQVEFIKIPIDDNGQCKSYTELFSSVVRGDTLRRSFCNKFYYQQHAVCLVLEYS